MRVKGQHGIDVLRNAVNELKAVRAAGGSKADIVENWMSWVGWLPEGSEAMNEIEIANQIRAAVKKKDIGLVRSLIGNSKDWINYMTPFGTWLHVAAKGGMLK